MNHIGLFEGIGGFSLAAKWMGWKTVAWCEIKEECQKVLRHHFPEAEGHGDIKTTDFKKYANRIDILTGGFPCQPYSTAGKRLGNEDDRHLWPEMLRSIREIRPRWVVGENVRGLISWNGGLVFDQVQADLEAEGYEVLPFLLPACAVNAPHRRDRVWIIAHSTKTNGGNALHTRTGRNGIAGMDDAWNVTDTECERQQRQRQNIGSISPAANSIWQADWAFNGNEGGWIPKQWQKFPTQPPVCNGNDGLPNELLRQRIREDSMGYLSEKEIDQILSKAATKWREEALMGMGNAVVPPLVLQIFKAIEQYEETIYNPSA